MILQDAGSIRDLHKAITSTFPHVAHLPALFAERPDALRALQLPNSLTTGIGSGVPKMFFACVHDGGKVLLGANSENWTGYPEAAELSRSERDATMALYLSFV